MHHLSCVPSLSYHLGPIEGTWSIAERTNIRRQPLVESGSFSDTFLNRQLNFGRPCGDALAQLAVSAAGSLAD
jgi:hypothetical protein